MALLKIKKNGKIINELNLDSSRSYVAGRKEGADILIESAKAVSREHFILKFTDDNWQVEVLSKFGDLIYQNEKVRNFTLSEEGVFSLPPYEFEFLKREVQASTVNGSKVNLPDDNVVDEFEKTMVGTVEYIPQIQFLSDNLLNQKTITLSSQQEWVAGRDLTCEIQIEDQRVSRRQFKIVKIQSEYFLEDLGSVNGTVLNNKNIVPNEKIKIRSGDKIQVLDNVMLFELKDPNFAKGLMDLKSLVTVGTNPVNTFGNQDPSGTNALINFGTQVPTVVDNSMNFQQYPYPYMPTPHDPQFHGAQATVAGSPEFESEEDDKKKKMRMALVAAVAVVALGVIYSEFIAPPAKTNQVKSSDPFAKVNPNELSLIKQSKEIANDYYYKKSYRLALDETQKIIRKLEELGVNYKKTKFGQEVEELDKKAALAIEAENEIIEINTKMEEQRKNEEKLSAVVDQCNDKLNKNSSMTMDDYDSCIISVIHINPSHPKIQSAKLKIQELTEERTRKQLEQKLYRENAARLKALFNKAVRSEKEGSFIQAIEDYKLVIRQNLPDPEALKDLSKRKVASIESMISSKSVGFVQEAEKLASEKKYKESILKLRAALRVNPIDVSLEQRIQFYKRELAKEIKPIWEEATIEETYSQVECTENKSCAIEKWKKILQMDVNDGEYYIKAFTKLKKYGAH